MNVRRLESSALARSTAQLTLVLALGLSAGCFKHLGDAPDASGPVTDDGGAQDGGAQDPGDDAGPSTQPEVPGYRWIANGPEGEREEGPVSFDLRCESPDRKPADCTFHCAMNGNDEETCETTYELEWASAGPRLDPRMHSFCVRATARDEADAPSERVCREFVSTPYGRAFTWVVQEISPSSTELDLAMTCSQPLADGGTSEPRTDCLFGCSVDGSPYQACGEISLSEDGRFHRAGLAPGEHVLRIKTGGPQDPESHVTRVTELTFQVAEGAQPPVDDTPISLPTLLDEQALTDAGLGRVLDAYGPYAAVCDRRASFSATQHREWLRTTLSYALAGGAVVASPDEVEECVDELDRSPPVCRSLPGHAESYMEDALLRVRLPETCWRVVSGPGFGGDRCLTNGECAFGTCERSEPFDVDLPELGYCTDDFFPSEEGIMCVTRGCDDGLYCRRGLCAPLLAPDAPCDRFGEAADCPEGYTCSGSPDRCVLANARIGDTCRFNRDCIEGRCLNHVCAE